MEHAYQTEEQRYCSETEPDVLASTTAALKSFEDALLALKVVNDATPGINPIERQVYEQRIKNMEALQSAYLTRQNTALAVNHENPVKIKDQTSPLNHFLRR